MNNFQPIDHKDTSEEYRNQVWAGVATKVGEEIKPISETSEIVGTWKMLGDCDSELLFYFAFNSNGTVEVHNKYGDVNVKDFSVTNGVVTIKYNRYHCAFSTSRKLVIFNGDGSFCMIGHRCQVVSWE